MSPRQEATFEAIRKLTAENSYPPSFQELADELGVTRPTVCQHVRALRRKGWISQRDGVPRSLVLVL